ncbi:MAG: IPT/TIG domain-containing protein [Solirubrobacteraceae bacterium]
MTVGALAGVGGSLAVAACASLPGLALSTATAWAAPPAPLVSALAPASGPAEGGTEVRVSGEGFAECSVFTGIGEGPPELLPRGCEQDIVRFGEAPGLVAGATSTEIDVFAPAHAAGTVDVTVTTSGGESHRGVADHFLYTGTPPAPESGPLPVVSAVVPHEGPAAGFTEVTVRGKHLLPVGVSHCLECAGVVVFFGTLAVPVLEGSSEELGVVAPPHPPGTVAVSVSTPSGTSETSGYDTAGATDSYTYLCGVLFGDGDHHHCRVHHGRRIGHGAHRGVRGSR